MRDTTHDTTVSDASGASATMHEPLMLSLPMLRFAGACDLSDRAADMAHYLGTDDCPEQPLPLSDWWKLPTTTLDDTLWSLRCFDQRGIEIVCAFVDCAVERMLCAMAQVPADSSDSKHKWARSYLRNALNIQERMSGDNGPAYRRFKIVRIADVSRYARQLAEMLVDDAPTGTLWKEECCAQMTDLWRLAIGEEPPADVLTRLGAVPYSPPSISEGR